jgi:hypothetical protein
MNSILVKLTKVTVNRRNIFLTGLFIVVLITLKDIFSASYNNFQIFSYGSLDFWNGNNPYTSWIHLSVIGKHLDYFLYSPQFSILFTPFALLPSKAGVLCWNLFTYSLFFYSVFSLPQQFTFGDKKFIFIYTYLLLLQTIFSEQFNPVVAALFLISFTLLEEDRGFWAVFLIMLSGFTKIYGFFQIGMLLFYPRFWKRILFALLIGTIFFLLPLIKIPWNQLLDYYNSWIKIMLAHSSNPIRFEIIYRPLFLLWEPVKSIMGIISLGVLGLLYLAGLLELRLFKGSFTHRVRFLGILMVFAILFGTVSEMNTYLIASAGYAMWFLNSQPTRLNKVLLWLNFILLGVAPIDLLCPDKLAILLIDKLNLGVIVLTFTWIIMIYELITLGLATNKAIERNILK